MFAQRAGRTEGAQDVMRGADQQAAHQTVAAFADAQLFVRAAALVAARTQTQIRAHVAAAVEALRIADLQDEAQRGERAHAGDLLESLRGGILFLAALHQVAFHALDLFGHLDEHGDQGLNHRQTIRRDVGQHRLVKRLAGGITQGMTEALERETDGIDEVDAGADEGIAEFEAEQIMLGLGGAVFDGMEQGGINPREPGEHPGVALVALALVAGDGVELARVGHNDLRPKFGEEPADPRAVHAGFHRHRGAGEIGQQPGQRGPGVGQRALADDLAGSIQDADVMRAVTEIQTEGEPADEGSGRSENN